MAISFARKIFIYLQVFSKKFARKSSKFPAARKTETIAIAVDYCCVEKDIEDDNEDYNKVKISTRPGNLIKKPVECW